MDSLIHQINIRISNEDKKKINILSMEPYNINISDFIRASIRNIYRVRTEKRKNEISQTQTNSEN